MTPVLTAALAGLGFGLSLIVAIGAQNAYVLRQGLRKEHVFVIVAICALSDAALIAVGVAGLGAIIQQLEWLLLLIEVIGGVFLCTYGVMAAKRAWKPEVLNTDTGGAAISLKVAVGTVLALTYLNPHVYLDTVLLLGSVAGTYEANRWWFAAGAMLGSIIWFSTLGFGARLLAPVFKKPTAWRVLDAIIAVVMFTLGMSLLVSFVQHLVT
ncbi:MULTISPECIES: LysE/ArgO family amino acid transporter [Aurantimicrobium]|jgi:L-lysine exporter family protein LysE/ArgO|uniref:Arginine exporter protein ArgO n=1 Tax=Aurantimicrobium photophilum TaxID=1987356 RepID=A0A2Z3RXV8_9MICO|nr:MULTISPECIES: LysE/ArgO family amino acid transporter [Aurantimicrobium]AWR21637.1 Arginine exporter protein ArgO [Aurantimicrobium photophilum]MDF9810386.1 L-lysine exporter family protein LysE/ArgO [Aurantimicrobium minutum]